jgi:hypothetical protein
MPNPLSIAFSASQYKTQKTAFASNATPQKMVSANPNRVAMIISDQAGSIQLGTVDKQPSTSFGLICLSSSYQTVMLAFDLHGPLVQEEWWCCRLSGTSTTGIIEIIYSPSG